MSLLVDAFDGGFLGHWLTRIPRQPNEQGNIEPTVLTQGETDLLRCLIAKHHSGTAFTNSDGEVCGVWLCECNDCQDGVIAPFIRQTRISLESGHKSGTSYELWDGEDVMLINLVDGVESYWPPRREWIDWTAKSKRNPKRRRSASRQRLRTAQT